MFGNYNLVNGNNLIEKVDFQLQSDSHYKAVNNNQVIIINTSLARVYINEDTYFANIPESAWKASFAGEPTPELFLKEKIGKTISEREIRDFQQLLTDLIDAEFKARSQS